MKKTLIVVAAIIAAGMVGVVPATAQELTLGTWTGTMTPPRAEPVHVSYAVADTDGGLSIVMTSAQVSGEMPFQDVSYDGDALVFWWDAGVRVDCTLHWSDGSLQGTCSDGRPTDGEGAMTMTPPGAPLR